MSGEAQIAYLRKSADWRLKRYTDIAGATELYRRMLELLPPERRTATAKEDTWLLRRLKHDMKETPNAHART
jgi:hypothetical protein